MVIRFKKLIGGTIQYPIYNLVTIGNFFTVASNDSNIDYMIMLKNSQTGKTENISFILIRNDFANAELYFTANSSPAKIDLKSCF